MAQEIIAVKRASLRRNRRPKCKVTVEDEIVALDASARFLEKADAATRGRFMNYLTDRFFPEGRFIPEVQLRIAPGYEETMYDKVLRAAGPMERH